MGSERDSSTTQRPRLSRARVVDTAIHLVDDEGLDALSMRALAAVLGVVPMALYKHVADREDLIGGMIDRIIAGYAPPSGGGWRERVRSRVLIAKAACDAHPWLSRAITTRTRRTETVFAHMNAVSGEFIEGGLTPDLTHYAMHALGTRIWGFSDEAFEDADAPTPADAEEQEVAAYFAERYPHVVTIAMDAAARNPSGGCEQQTEFEFTLDLLLDAFERLHEAGWISNAVER